MVKVIKMIEIKENLKTLDNINESIIKWYEDNKRAKDTSLNDNSLNDTSLNVKDIGDGLVVTGSALMKTGINMGPVTPESVMLSVLGGVTYGVGLLTRSCATDKDQKYKPMSCSELISLTQQRDRTVRRLRVNLEQFMTGYGKVMNFEQKNILHPYVMEMREIINKFNEKTYLDSLRLSQNIAEVWKLIRTIEGIRF